MSTILFRKNFKLITEKFKVTTSEIYNNTKIKKDTLNNYEFTSVLPSYKNILKLSNYFGLSIDFLLLNSNNKFINFFELFSLAEKSNKLPSTWRNHIEESISPYINQKDNDVSSFDSVDKYSFTKSIHENIKIIRKVNNISQSELAKVLNLKSRVSIALYEKKSNPPYEILLKLSKKYNISVHYLLTGVPLHFSIEDNLLLKNLLIFDKTASLEEFKVITPPIKKILENNGITV